MEWELWINTRYTEQQRFFKHAADVDLDSKSIAAEIVRNDTATSMAAEARRILMNERDVSLQSDKKSLKRERERKIKSRYWHVRGIDEELEPYRAKRVTFPARTNALFSEMYHYHCAPQFPLGTAAVRRIPCACSTCDALIKTKWDPDITDFKDQPRFQQNDNCYMEPIMKTNND